MKIHLQYGRGELAVELPTRNVTVIRPSFMPGLPDEQDAFIEAVNQPL